jgi:hypothetical protein
VDEDGAGHTSRFNSLLRLEASQANISQSGLNTAECVARMVHEASSQRLCQNQVEDGWVDVASYVGPYYPDFSVFFVLALRNILVF